MAAPDFPLTHLCLTQHSHRVHIKFNQWPNNSSYLCQALSYFKILSFSSMQRALGRVQWVWGFLSGVFWGECIQALLSLPHGFSLCSWPSCIHAHRRSQRKGEDRRGPALDLLWIGKAFMKSPLHVIPTPAPPPPGRFSLNTHLTFHNFLHFSRTRGNIQQDRPQDRLVTKGTRAQMGPTEAPGPKGAGVVAQCTGKATAGTPWKPHPPQDTDVQALLFLLSLPFSDLSSSFRFLLSRLSLCSSFSPKTICLFRGNSLEYNP